MNSSPPLRLAMLGMIPGNGHPYSWSAIINGYDPAMMASCPYTGIPEYLGRQPLEAVRIEGVRVTHIWTDDPNEAPLVAAASLIPNVVPNAEDVIGCVDAVLISTDDGFDHVRRCRPFVEAGLPVFVDKPLAASLDDLKTFIEWKRNGAPILSFSGLRCAPELDPILMSPGELGPLRWAMGIMSKTWERYGIHAVEPLFQIVGPGFASVRLETGSGVEVAHIANRTGVQLTIPVIYDGAATFGTFHLCGTGGQRTMRLTDAYTAFRRQLVSFVDFVRSRQDPFPFAETVEMMAVIIAGLRSRAEQCRRVDVAEITSALPS